MTARPALVSVATVAMLCALAGCGSGTDDSGSADSAGTPAPSSSAPAEPESPAPEESSAPAEPESSAPAEPESSAPAEEPAVITIKDFEYAGPESVAPGATIMVKNEDDVAHTVTAEGDGGFDVTIDPGGTAELTAPDAPGEYPYICTFHANMTGTLVVG